jgi:hypothetical protein
MPAMATGRLGRQCKQKEKTMFYTVNDYDGKILDMSRTCPDPQKQADFFMCAVYIIEGENTGLAAVPSEKAQEILILQE